MRGKHVQEALSTWVARPEPRTASPWKSTGQPRSECFASLDDSTKGPWCLAEPPGKRDCAEQWPLLPQQHLAVLFMGPSQPHELVDSVPSSPMLYSFRALSMSGEQGAKQHNEASPGRGLHCICGLLTMIGWVRRALWASTAPPFLLPGRVLPTSGRITGSCGDGNQSSPLVTRDQSRVTCGLRLSRVII